MTWLSKFRLHRQRTPGQTPRAQRYMIRLPVRYRCRGDREWRRGMTENISCTGLLFQTGEILPPQTPVEISFKLPTQITGRSEVRVACAGYIVRSITPARTNDAPLLAAAAILDYRLLYGEQRPEATLEKAVEQERQRQWAAQIGRRFNEQLAIVVGNSEIALAHPDLPEALRRKIEQAKLAALRASEIIEQLATEGDHL